MPVLGPAGGTTVGNSWRMDGGEDQGWASNWLWTRKFYHPSAYSTP